MMASADYWLCDWCGCKAFYDANLDYDNSGRTRRGDGRMLPSGAGDARVLCEECALTKEVIVRPIQSTATPPDGSE